jgi:hypothetical protein
MWVGDWKADLDFRALEQPELEVYQVGLERGRPLAKASADWGQAPEAGRLKAA